MNIILKSLIAGTIITLSLFALSWLTALADWLDFSYLLYWQGWVLQLLVPCNDIGIPGAPACEMSRSHLLAFYAGLPVGVLVYSTLAYIGLSLRRRVSH